MKVAMPVGNTHGWGIAGSYLSAEIAKLPPIEGVTLHAVAGHHFGASFPEAWDRINIGYCFFESEILAYRYIPEASRRWDHIVAGSSWCEYHLRIAGMERTSTVLQGIDPAVFSPLPAKSDDGRFIVFSGGKFEFRKGHDLVIAAMRRFMSAHPDVWLACSWHNHWPASIKTMEQSGLINFSYRDLPCQDLYLQLLSDNGIPLERLLLYPVLDNRQMKQVYAASDIGLFPNRCEGGNNMVMCEYMACGRPVIASSLTGHMDVINSGNAFCLQNYEPIIATMDGFATGVWFEPSLDETVALLEQAYGDRTAISRLGAAAGEAMTALSWQSAAKRFHATGMRLADSLAVKNATPTSPPTLKKAAELFEEGRYFEAEKEYCRLLNLFPLDPELHNNIGTVLDRLERFTEALMHYEKALALRPSYVDARFNLANTLQRRGDSLAAVEELKGVVEANPDYIAAWKSLALCRFGRRELPEAVYALEQVLRLDPASVKSRSDLGEILLEMGRHQESIDCFDLVLKQEPENAGVLNSKGVALQWLNRLDEAEICFCKILEQDPGNSLALNNMGAVMRSKGSPEEATVYFSRALESTPGDPQILFNRSLALLLTGDFDNGWREYEQRFHCNLPNKLRHQHLPRWRGESLAGKTILVWCEQGYGDSIQFIRYARLLNEAGATVIIEAPDEVIAPLLRRAAGVSEVHTRGETIINADLQMPLLSIPQIMGNIPCPPLYLELEPLATSWWRAQLPADPRIKVGLAWAGRPAHEDDRNRSIPPRLLKPLERCSNVLFINLQIGPAETVNGLSMLNLTDKITSFADSAGLIATLDLVITVDSAVAHLAGALGVPVWILLPFNPDWRWGTTSSRTFWYDSATLFRQKKVFEWETVIDEVIHNIKMLDRK